MKKVLFPIFYLPPIAWFSLFLDNEVDVELEQFENFPKQTYRNRANIYGANGKLSLIIPIKHNGERALKSIEYSDAENWKNLHWKSIKTAYQSSPYFEYYEAELSKIFEFQNSNLMQFNLNALQIIMKILKSQKSFIFTNDYVKEPESIDFREKFTAKSEEQYHFFEYYQSFSEKHGFIENLSILDLICNIGPESVTYLKNNKIKI